MPARSSIVPVVVATLVLIRTRDTKSHLEMSNEQAATATA